jgi:hypothetical protein
VLVDFENATYPGQCVAGYTAGSLANCLCRVASYTSCDDYKNRPCTLQVILDPTGAACGGDGGTDGATDSLPDTSAFDVADAGEGG